jgi:hypothetical protein
MEVYKNPRHGDHRPVQFGPEHLHPLPQSDERSRPRASARPYDPLPRSDITGKDVDPVAVPTIGMVFQRPNPFPKSIHDNVAWGLSAR